jgi:uncharacterized protein
LELSKHNIISQIYNSERYFIVNLLSQQADILTQAEYVKLCSGYVSDNEDYILKGYYVDQVEETSHFRKKYLEFLKSRENDEVQLFFVSSYACNFGCSYCYQNSYQQSMGVPNKEVVNAFFKYIQTQFSDRRKYLTLFGGEPLMNNLAQKEFIENFIQKANEQKLDIAIVTNGFNLAEYIPILKQASIREIQVTLDGVGQIHDQRRPLKNGSPTFDKIVEGIDKALRSNFPINLRMVIDQNNIEDLPELARFTLKKGWLNNPLFKTQLGRNYELHDCQADATRLYSRLGLYQDIYRLIQRYPEIAVFHKPAFSITRFLFENGELPDPLFDSCPGTKTEWAFDSSGKIYSCTATVGKTGEELGTFYPDIVLDEEKIAGWETRDVLAINECKLCALQLACGGGCASIAKNLTNRLDAPDCRPVKELMELGMSLYFE